MTVRHLDRDTYFRALRTAADWWVGHTWPASDVLPLRQMAESCFTRIDVARWVLPL